MLEFKKSTNKNKKYMVKTPKGKWIHFGNINFQQYKDTTGLGLYSHLNHLDKKRRDNYRARHKAILKKDGKPAYLDKEQPAYWSYNFLW
jgi:hypothetical protein